MNRRKRLLPYCLGIYDGVSVCVCSFLLEAFGDACLIGERTETHALLYVKPSNRLLSMHIGNVLREQLKKDGKSVVWLAHELGCHRTNIYNLFDKYSIDTQLLERISIIMHRNFFDLYSQETTEKMSKDQP